MDLPLMACTARLRKEAHLRPLASSEEEEEEGALRACGMAMPAMSRTVGAKSITVLKERLRDPGWRERCRVSCGGLRMQGTRIPPWEGKHLKRREGAVEACAQRGPSLFLRLAQDADEKRY